MGNSGEDTCYLADSYFPPRRLFFEWHGIKFHAGMHLWSNPSLRGTPAEIPVVLADPTLFDLVELARRISIENLRSINGLLLADGIITVRQFERTQDILAKIDSVQRQLLDRSRRRRSQLGNPFESGA